LLSLFGLGRGTLSIEISQLQLVVLSFFVKKALVFSISRLPFSLDRVKFFLETGVFLCGLFKSLFQRPLLRHLRLGLELVLIKKSFLLSLYLLVARLQLKDLSLCPLLDLFEKLLMLSLKLDELERV
jgi:hypothetical protein